MLARGSSGRVAAALRKGSARAASLQPTAYSNPNRRPHNALYHGPLSLTLAIRTYASAAEAALQKRKRSPAVKKAISKAESRVGKLKPPPKKPKKKKAPKKKKKVVKVPKKPLTLEERQTKRRDARIKELRKQALLVEEPSAGPTPYSMFVSERMTGARGARGDGFREAGTLWKSVSDSEKQAFQARAKELTEKRKEEHKAWVKQHTAEEIRLANLARASLARLNRKMEAAGLAQPRPRLLKVYKKIEDERQIKRPMSAFTLFFKQQIDNGELDHIALITQRAQETGRRWKSLSAAQRKPYEEEAQDLKVAWERSYARTYKTKT